jgi:hypothetical protein
MNPEPIRKPAKFIARPDFAAHWLYNPIAEWWLLIL